jgi:hypothetical protein
LLVPSDGVLSPSLRESIHNSGCEVELIGHPLFAMAAVVWREVNARKPLSGASTAFIAAEVDIQDLNPLFNAIRNRLPHVSTWVFHGDLAVLISAAQPRTEPGTGQTAQMDLETKPEPVRGVSPTRREAPTLKIAEGTAFSALHDELHNTESPSAKAHDVGVTDRDLDEIERRFRGDDHIDDATEPEEEPAPSAVRITHEELAMLMNDDQSDDAPPPRGAGGPRGGER